MVELVIAIVVLSIGAVTFLELVVNMTRDSADPVIQEQAYAIAQSYMEEIVTQPFCDPDFSVDCRSNCTAANACTVCSLPEGSRSLFDDVCDYGGLSDSGAEDFYGPIPGLASYIVDVTIDDSGETLSGLSSASGQLVRVDVRVRHAHSADLDVTLTGYKVNF
jgi:MSHA pilin protein MshD